MFSPKTWYRLATLTAFVCAFALTGCAEKKNDLPKPEGEPKPADAKGGPLALAGPTAPTESLVKVKPDAAFTAKEYLAEVQKDSLFPLSKFKGKVIEVTGTVLRYGGGSNTNVLILLAGPEKRIPDDINCPTTEKAPWKKVLPSQNVTLRMRIPGSDWEIVDVKGPPPPTFTAEQLAKERAANPNSFDDKYDGKYLIVSGVIGKAEHEADGTIQVLLGEGDMRVVCTFPAIDKDDPSKEARKKLLQVGQKVKLLGNYGLGKLLFCIILEPAP